MSDLDKVKGDILQVKIRLPEKSGIYDILLDESDEKVVVVKDDRRRVAWTIPEFRR